MEDWENHKKHKDCYEVTCVECNKEELEGTDKMITKELKKLTKIFGHREKVLSRIERYSKKE